MKVPLVRIRPKIGELTLRHRPTSSTKSVESGHWRGPEHDKYLALYNQAMVTADAGKRKAIYAEMQAILHEEVPAILPAGGNTLMIKRKHMRNMPYHPQIWSIRYEEIWRA